VKLLCFSELVSPPTPHDPQDEECISLEPWRLAICGDYISHGTEGLGAHACSVEAAALSGLEAGERVGAWLQKYQLEK
jgi:predicted NAD/FAD-dependent oxidoreductase